MHELSQKNVWGENSDLLITVKSIIILFTMFSVGCVVWGRWTNNLYYHGRVTSTSGGKIHVTFDDGDQISHNLNDISGVIVDMVPNPAHVPVGCHVIAAWPGRSHYYRGRVTQIDPTNFYAPRYFVTYDDGDKAWVTFDQVRLLPMRVNEGKFHVQVKYE
jgi:hypothetical protein